MFRIPGLCELGMTRTRAIRLTSTAPRLAELYLELANSIAFHQSAPTLDMLHLAQSLKTAAPMCRSNGNELLFEELQSV